MFYRDGCFCESFWSGGCPFSLHLTPSFKEFGFRDREQKMVSGKVGTSQPNALCWYWSAPTYPEHGYEYGVARGSSFQAPLKNGTEELEAWNSKTEEDQKRSRAYRP